MKEERTICFLLLSQAHLMDIAGPAQVFYEASQLGPLTYKFIYCGTRASLTTEQGLQIANLQDFEKTNLKKSDYVIVPGIDFNSFKSGTHRQEIRQIRPWLRMQVEKGVTVASICSGSLILAVCGILNEKKCTSHWKCIEYMIDRFPRVDVLIDRLFVKSDNIYTSAGMSSGIDMSLAILENHHGPVLPAKVAREMVVYLRRGGIDSQQTIYLDYQTHFNPIIHKVQDYIISHPSEELGVSQLASICNLSVRSLTRLFKAATNHTIVEFKNAVRIELARTLLHNNDFTLDKIATLSGFRSSRHLRRVWEKSAPEPLRRSKKANR